MSSARGMAKRAPTRSRPRATRASSPASPVSVALRHAVSRRVRASAVPPARNRSSASWARSRTCSSSGNRQPASATAVRTRPRCPAASANAYRAVSASAAACAHVTAGAGPGNRDRGGEMPGQLGGEDPAAALVPAPHRKSDPLVQFQPAPCRQGGVDRLPVEVVREADGVPVADQDTGGQRRGGPVGDDRRRLAGHLAQHVRVEDGAGYRGRVQQRAAAGGQPGEAAADRLPHRDRYAVRRPARRQQVAELAGEERVPAAAFVHQRRPAARRRLAGKGSNHVGDLGRGQPAQADQLGRGGQVGERRGHSRGRFAGTVGADQQEAAPCGLPDEEAQQIHRRGVGPLQVVEHHHGRPAIGRPAQQPAHRVEDPHAAGVLRVR